MLWSAASCGDPTAGPEFELDAYLHDASARREVLHRDLVATDNAYAQLRLDNYALPSAWDALPEYDPPSHSVSESEATSSPTLDTARALTLMPTSLPSTDQEWIDLGQRVWFEYPFTVGDTLQATASAGRLRQLGVLVWEDELVGVRMADDLDGNPRLAPTCALCHAALDAASGEPSAIRSNRALNLGGLRLIAIEAGDQGDATSEIDTSSIAQLEHLGLGRSDPTQDGRFNPYAFPDLGGIAERPYLHHTANWRNDSVTTLAIRIETVYITGNGQRTRIPRALSWAAAMYLRSLPPPSPSAPVDDATLAPGRAVFDATGCNECHPPPSYTGDRLVTLAEVGTDPAAGQSDTRGTGYYRVESLLGVGDAGPYLHDGSVATLEALLDPARRSPGHRFGLTLSESEREALLVFLRGI